MDQDLDIQRAVKASLDPRNDANLYSNLLRFRDLVGHRRFQPHKDVHFGDCNPKCLENIYTDHFPPHQFPNLNITVATIRSRISDLISGATPFRGGLKDAVLSDPILATLGILTTHQDLCDELIRDGLADSHYGHLLLNHSRSTQLRTLQSLVRQTALGPTRPSLYLSAAVTLTAAYSLAYEQNLPLIPIRADVFDPTTVREFMDNMTVPRADFMFGNGNHYIAVSVFREEGFTTPPASPGSSCYATPYAGTTHLSTPPHFSRDRTPRRFRRAADQSLRYPGFADTYTWLEENPGRWQSRMRLLAPCTQAELVWVLTQFPQFHRLCILDRLPPSSRTSKADRILECVKIGEASNDPDQRYTPIIDRVTNIPATLVPPPPQALGIDIVFHPEDPDTHGGALPHTQPPSPPRLQRSTPYTGFPPVPVLAHISRDNLDADHEPEICTSTPDGAFHGDHVLLFACAAVRQPHQSRATYAVGFEIFKVDAHRRMTRAAVGGAYMGAFQFTGYFAVQMNGLIWALSCASSAGLDIKWVVNPCGSLMSHVSSITEVVEHEPDDDEPPRYHQTPHPAVQYTEQVLDSFIWASTYNHDVSFLTCPADEVDVCQQLAQQALQRQSTHWWPTSTTQWSSAFGSWRVRMSHDPTVMAAPASQFFNWTPPTPSPDRGSGGPPSDLDPDGVDNNNHDAPPGGGRGSYDRSPRNSSNSDDFPDDFGFSEDGDNSRHDSIHNTPPSDDGGSHSSRGSKWAPSAPIRTPPPTAPPEPDPPQPFHHDISTILEELDRAVRRCPQDNRSAQWLTDTMVKVLSSASLPPDSLAEGGSIQTWFQQHCSIRPQRQAAPPSTSGRFNFTTGSVDVAWQSIVSKYLSSTTPTGRPSGASVKPPPRRSSNNNTVWRPVQQPVPPSTSGRPPPGHHRPRPSSDNCSRSGRSRSSNDSSRKRPPPPPQPSRGNRSPKRHGHHTNPRSVRAGRFDTSGSERQWWYISIKGMGEHTEADDFVDHLRIIGVRVPQDTRIYQQKGTTRIMVTSSRQLCDDIISQAQRKAQSLPGIKFKRYDPTILPASQSERWAFTATLAAINDIKHGKGSSNSRLHQYPPPVTNHIRSPCANRPSQSNKRSNKFRGSHHKRQRRESNTHRPQSPVSSISSGSSDKSHSRHTRSISGSPPPLSPSLPTPQPRSSKRWFVTVGGVDTHYSNSSFRNRLTQAGIPIPSSVQIHLGCGMTRVLSCSSQSEAQEVINLFQNGGRGMPRMWARPYNPTFHPPHPVQYKAFVQALQSDGAPGSV